MNMQAMFDKMVNDAREKTFAESSQLTLGEIISKVESIIDFRTKNQDPPGTAEEPIVYFDFVNTYPTCLDSWRGAYKELAFDFCHGHGKEKPMPISEFLRVLKDTIGQTFTGYKGGDFTMDESTPVWVANYGESGDTGVLDITDDGYLVTIKTGKCEF